MPEDIARFKVEFDSSGAIRDIDKLDKKQEQLKRSSVGVAEAHDDQARATDNLSGRNKVAARSASELVDSLKNMSETQRGLEASKVRLAKAQTDLTSAESHYNAVAKSSTASDRDRVDATAKLHSAYNRVSVAEKALTNETRDLTNEQSRLGRAFSDGGRDGNAFSRAIASVGDSFRKARSSGKSFGAIINAFKIPGIIAAVNILIGAVVNLAGGLYALLPALGQVSSLVAVLPSLFLAAAQSVGTLFAAFKGIGAALKAYGEAQTNAGEEAAAASDAQEQAARGVEDAERSLADAKENARQAEEDLTQAREDAREALQDLRIEAERAELTEKRSQLNLRAAKQNLQELLSPQSDANADDIASARLDIAEAELDLKDARHQNQRTAEDLAEEERKGIERSDAVTAARDRLADATQGVSDAEQNLQDAMKASADAMSNTAASQQKLQDALKDMPPIAREFVKYLYQFKDLLTDIRATAQKNLFPGLMDGLEALKPLLPVINRMVGRTAAIFGDFAARLGELVGSRDFRTGLTQIFKTNETFLKRMGNATLYVIEAFKDLAVAARPIVNWLGIVAEKWALYFRNAVSAGEASGELSDYFRKAIDTAKQLGAIIADLIGVLFDVGKASSDVGASMWESIADTVDKWHEWTSGFEGQNAMKEWFEGAEPVVRETIGLIGDLAKVFFSMGENSTSSLVPLIQQMRAELVPAIEDVAHSLDDAFGPELVHTITLILELLEDLGGQSGGLTAFLRVINRFFEAVDWIIENVPGASDALTAFFVAAGTLQGLHFVGSIFSTLIGPVKALSAELAGAVLRFRGLRNAGVEAGKFLPSVASIFDGVKSAASSMLAFLGLTAGQFLLIAAGVAAAGFLIYKNWDKIGPVFWDLVAGLKKTFLPIWESVVDAAKRLWDVAKPALEALWGALQRLTSALTPLWNALAPILKVAAWVVVIGQIWFFVAALKALAFVAQVVADVAEFVARNWHSVVEVFSTIADFFKGVFIPIWNQIKEAALRAWNSLKGIFQTLKRAFEDLWRSLGDTFSALKDAFQPVIDVFMKLWDIVYPILSELFKPFAAFILGVLVAVLIGPLIVALKMAAFWFDKLADVVEFVERNLHTFINFFIHIINGVIFGINKLITAYNKLPFHDDIPYIDDLETLDGVQSDAARSAEELTTAANATGLAHRDAAGHILTYKQALYEAADEQEQAKMRSDEFADSLQGQRGAIRTWSDITGKSFKDFKEEGRDAFRESADAGQAWVDEQLAAIREYKEGIQEDFNGVQGSLDELANKHKLTADKILKTFTDQLDTMDEYDKNWRIVSERAGDKADDLLDHIKDMGLDGAGLLEALADANDDEFKKILGKWEDGKKGAKDLGDMVGDTLSGSIDHLTEVLKNIPNQIAIALGLDTSKATEALDKFYQKLIDKGMTLEGASRLTHQKNEDDNNGGTSTSHTGGWAGKSNTRTIRGRRSNEVDTRLLKDEFVVNPKASKANAGLLEKMNNGDPFSVEEPVMYHIGGKVTGSANPVTEAMQGYQRFLQSLKSMGSLKAPKFKAGPKWSFPFGAVGDYGAAKGGFTQGMWNLDKYAMENWGKGIYGGPVPGHTYSGSTGYSQHAYGNARDYSGSKSAMNKLYYGVVKAVKEGPLKGLLRTAIHNDTAVSWPGYGMSDYDPVPGATGDVEHWLHVHLDAMPTYGGTPPGHPVEGRGYLRGGKVKKDGSAAHRDEYVVNKSATRSVGTGFLDAINSLGAGNRPESGTAHFLSALGTSLTPQTYNPILPNMGAVGTAGAPQAVGSNAGTKEQVRLQVDIDGETLVRTMEAHSRDMKLRVGGRTRAGLNSGGR